MRTNNSFSTNDVILNQLHAQVAELNKALKQEQGKRKKLRECLTSIAEKVCDIEYSNGQLGGKNEMATMSDIQLRDFIIKNALHQRVQFARQMTEVQNLYMQEYTEKSNISQQLIQLQREHNALVMEFDKFKQKAVLNQSGINNTQTDMDSSFDSVSSGPEIPDYSSNEDTSNFMQSFDMPQTNMQMNAQQSNFNMQQSAMPSFDSQPSMQNTGNQPVSNDIVYVDNQPYDMQQIRSQLDTYRMELIKIIGKSGLNEQPAIVNACVQTGQLGADTLIRSNLKQLVDSHVLIQTDLSIPTRGKITLYNLSEAGTKIYSELTKQVAPKDEMTRIKEMHATLQHGYCIKTTAGILANLGYQNICIDSAKNSVTIADGRRYVPDITAMSNNTKTYWELELGHHHDADMAEKLEKAAKVTKTVYIVVDNNETKQKLIQQVNFFRMQLLKKNMTVDLIIYLGTMTELKNRTYLTNEQNKWVMAPKREIEKVQKPNQPNRQKQNNNQQKKQRKNNNNKKK